jgi:LemA protein
MKKVSLVLAISLSAVVVLSGCGYNTMQQQEEKVFKAWGDVEATLQRRADLIPNLVETVKGYASHERGTLEAVINARSKATSVKLSTEDLSDPAALQRLQQSQGGLSSALSRLLMVVEQYPDLKANQNFRDLQNQLEGTENRINVARRRYNEAAEEFNGSIRTFPKSLTNGCYSPGNCSLLSPLFEDPAILRRPGFQDSIPAGRRICLAILLRLHKIMAVMH